VVLTLLTNMGTRKTKSEMAQITGSTPVRAHEKSVVKHMLEETLSSRSVDSMTTAVGAHKGLSEDTHDKLLPFRLGPKWYTQVLLLSRLFRTWLGGELSEWREVKTPFK